MTDELKHYGVLGMKWGVHKARTYAMETNNYIRRQSNKKAKAKLKSGEYSIGQYERAKAKNYQAMVKKNRNVIEKTAELTPKAGESISSIYNKYKAKAISTIPHYKLKKGAKTAASILLTIGSSYTSAVWSVGAASTSAGLYWQAVGKSTVKNFIRKRAANMAENAAIDAATLYIQDRAVKKRKEASKK